MCSSDLGILKENSSRKTGIVFVRSVGYRSDGTQVLEYVRWVMVRRGRGEAAASAPIAETTAPAEVGTGFFTG